MKKGILVNNIENIRSFKQIVLNVRLFNFVDLNGVFRLIITVGVEIFMVQIVLLQISPRPP